MISTTAVISTAVISTKLLDTGKYNCHYISYHRGHLNNDQSFFNITEVSIKCHFFKNFGKTVNLRKKKLIPATVAVITPLTVAGISTMIMPLKKNIRHWLLKLYSSVPFLILLTHMCSCRITSAYCFSSVSHFFLLS